MKANLSSTALTSNLDLPLDRPFVKPNPNFGRFEIQLPQQEGNYNISIFDIDGREIAGWMSVFKDRISIELPDIRNGIYFLKLSSSSIQETMSFIVQK